MSNSALKSSTRNRDGAQQLRDQGYFGEEIVTGEGVALELPSATALSRIISGAIDWILYVLLAIGIIISFVNNLSVNPATFNTLMIVTLAIFFWILPALITTLTRGASLGKYLLRCRVVRVDGGAISFRQSFIRATIGLGEILMSLGAVACFAVFSTKKAQRFGDMFAGTYVVRWPKGKLSEPNIVIAPTLLAWASLAQVRDLPAGLHLNIMNHFRTAQKLSPNVREAQAKTLAAAAENYVHPAPPWGTPAEEFLSAVVSLRYKIERKNGERIASQREKLNSQIADIPFSIS
ncbi:MAG: RDD family protein [Arcanobacterium sp.]|nr:RDD family protein [Arcanobacterium sp.]